MSKTEQRMVSLENRIKELELEILSLHSKILALQNAQGRMNVWNLPISVPSTDLNPYKITC